ncbi:unnamed protein product, partial [Urochloa humidicola]
ARPQPASLTFRFVESRLSSIAAAGSRTPPPLHFFPEALQAAASPLLSPPTPKRCSHSRNASSYRCAAAADGAFASDEPPRSPDHVVIIEKPKKGGGNITRQCKYSSIRKSASYTRAGAHLLRKKGNGIDVCP